MDTRFPPVDPALENLAGRVDYLKRIVEVSQILNSTLSLNPILDTIIESAQELTQSEACSIILLDQRTGDLRFSRSAGEGEQQLQDMMVPAGSSIAGTVIKSGQPLFIRDARHDPRWNPGIDQITKFQTRSILAVPLRAKDKIIGVLELLNKSDGRGFDEEDLKVALTLTDHAAIAIENARLVGELQRAYDDLLELDRLKNDFVSIVSHELRTPLSIILAYASLLEEELSGEAGHQLELVLQSATRLRTIIDDMVNLRHVDTGEATIEPSVFSVKEMVVEVCDQFSSLVRAKQQVLTQSLPADDLELEADREKICLVLYNLLSNAIKFTAAGGRIHVWAAGKGEDIRISVADTGIGIAERQYDRIFQRFYQVESSLDRCHDGIGLGLSTAKSMVDLHCGRIWVESVVGKGSRFTFSLPQVYCGDEPKPVVE